MHFEDRITPKIKVIYLRQIQLHAKDLKLSTFMSVVFIGSKEMTLRFYDFYSELA